MAVYSDEDTALLYSASQLWLAACSASKQMIAGITVIVHGCLVVHRVLSFYFAWLSTWGEIHTQ